MIDGNEVDFPKVWTGDSTSKLARWNYCPGRK